MDVLKISVPLVIGSSQIIDTGKTIRKNDKNIWQVETPITYQGSSYDLMNATPNLILKLPDGTTRTIKGVVDEGIFNIADFLLDETASAQVGTVTCEVILTTNSATLYTPFFIYRVADVVESEVKNESSSS